MLNETIRTDRLVLRPLRGDDAPTLNSLLTWEVARWLASVPWPNRLEDTEAFARRACDENATGRGVVHAIERGGAVAGVIALHPRDGALHFGYWLGEPFWGNGFMSEAAEAFVDAFFACNDVVHITSGAFAGNEASLRVQRKLGFVVVGETPLYSKSQRRTLPSFDTVLGRERRIQTCAA
ncbi:GNAT family N-acetyltransferase [Pseudochelatococcus sp. B33]